jgi:hypothetical protein
MSYDASYSARHTEWQCSNISQTISLYMENMNSHLRNINLQPNNEIEFSSFTNVRR